MGGRLTCLMVCFAGLTTVLSGGVASAKKAEANADVASDANAAYQAKDWRKAAESYAVITREHLENGRACRLGASLHGTRWRG